MGQSGKVAYPDYIEEFHDVMLGTDGLLDVSLDTDVAAEFNTIVGGSNPYEDAVAYDPEDELGTYQGQVDAFSTFVEGMSYLDDWTSIVETVADHVDDLLTTEEEITTLVTAFTEDRTFDLAQAYGRVAGGFFDAYANTSTAFPAALALLEAGHSREVARFEAGLRLERAKERAAVAAQCLQGVGQLMQMQVSALAQAAQLQERRAIITVAAYNEELQTNLNLSQQEIMWTLNVCKDASAALGAAAGVPGGVIKPQNLVLNALGGALGGAATVGVAAGSLFGAPGLLYGGIAGAILGLGLGVAQTIF